MLINKGLNLNVAAEKAGMIDRTARKYIKSGLLPDEPKKDHTWKTREDPFSEEENRIKEMLSDNPALEAKTVIDKLIEENPEKYHPGHLRTLQRRFRQSRPLESVYPIVFLDLFITW